jgi:serine/threonine-protein kinase
MFEADDTIGKWVIERCVAPGEPAFYACSRKDDDESHGLMKILPNLPHFVEQLRREARVLRDLEHEAVPKLVDFGQNSALGATWIVTEFYDGIPVSNRLMEGPMDWKEAARIVHRVAQAMAHMHSHGIVHRDINPNKIIDDDEHGPMLVGFELAMNDMELSRAASVDLGAISYTAPEVLTDPEHLGHRADLYSLGVVLYELITNRPAFPAALVEDKNAAQDQMLEWKTHAEPLDPGDDVPKWVGNLIRKATDPSTSGRLPDMDAFVGWLDAAEAAFAEEKKSGNPPPLSMGAAPKLTLSAPSIKREPPPPAPAAQVPLGTLMAASGFVGGVAGLGFALLICLVVVLQYTQ